MAALPEVRPAKVEDEIRLQDLYLHCSNPRSLFDWLRGRGFLIDLRGTKCSKCEDSNFTLVPDPKGASYKTDREYWECRTPSCRRRVSIRADSWFAGSHLSIPRLLLFTYLWIYRAPPAFIHRELGIGSSHTTIDWLNFSREVCLKVLERESRPIGGLNTVVEVCEFKFSKKSNNVKGQPVEGTWFFVGIERMDCNKCFIVQVPDCSPSTLIPLIKRYIEPGTGIVSDGWRSYDQLQAEGYFGQTADLNVEFVTEEGAKKNLKESVFKAARRQCSKGRTRTAARDSSVAEFIFRRRYLDGARDKFLEFLRKVSLVHPAKKPPAPAPCKK